MSLLTLEIGSEVFSCLVGELPSEVLLLFHWNKFKHLVSTLEAEVDDHVVLSHLSLFLRLPCGRVLPDQLQSMICFSCQTSDHVLDRPTNITRRLVTAWLLHHVHLDLLLMEVLWWLL